MRPYKILRMKEGDVFLLQQHETGWIAIERVGTIEEALLKVLDREKIICVVEKFPCDCLYSLLGGQ